VPHDSIGSSTPGAARSLDDLLSVINAPVSQQTDSGFACHMGSVTVAHRFAEERYDSYFASHTDSSSHGLEILTLDGISYARFTGAVIDDASAGHRTVRRKVGDQWATAGIPDTITLEELPASPSKCLEWVSIQTSDITDVRELHDGSWRFDVTTPEGQATGVVLDDELRIALNGDEYISVALSLDGVLMPSVTASGSRVPRGGVITLDQDEYSALVGG
jgi:hypothetical protein